MKTDPLLSKAARLAKKKDFDSALRILKSEEDRYYGSFKYYYLYAVISLHGGSHVEAVSYFRQAEKIKMKDPFTMLGLAVCSLKLHLDTVKAVDKYLDVKEIDPKNKIANRALAIIRKYSSSGELSDWLASERIKKLYPSIPRPSINVKSVIIYSFLLLAVVIFISGFLLKFNIFQNPVKKPNSRPTAEFVLSRQERAEPVQTSGSWSYILTRAQAASLYDNALSLFSSYRDEAAKVNINKILLSNTSQGIKNKAQLLLSYMETPGFDSFNRNDNPSYSEVKNEPALYRDVHIIWRGMATNIEITDEYTGFDFLVGYDTRTMLEGIVPVIFYSPVAINSERPLEVLGKIKLESSYTDISLEGIAIHQSGRLE